MIPLSVPHLAGNEWKYVKDCLDTGWISSVGSYVTDFENVFAKYVGSRFAIACVNGTNGLHMALHINDVVAGDHVIAPNITFIATLNSIKYAGAIPILIDVDERTWQMDMDLLEKFLKENTETRAGECFLKKTGKRISAVMPVHVLGNIGDIDKLIRICDEFNLVMIEDSTEALGSTYKGRHAGTFGKTGVSSFNGNKIISTGGGGMIVTDDESLAKRAKHLTTQAKLAGDEYMHDDIGYNYRLVNVLAAIGLAQMEQLPDFVIKKKYIADFYTKQLTGIGDIRFQEKLPEVDANCWLYTFRTGRMRDLLLHLKKNEIQSRPFWVPMNQLPMFKDDLFVTEKNVSGQIYNESISIPCSTGITDEQMQTVSSTIREFYN
jgi:aminotransferase in exopolysaccharide biosynthesis